MNGIDAMEKTKSLSRVFVGVGLLEANPMNPNEMTETQFNLLCDNIERIGLTDPILVVPHPEQEGMYRIIGGEHRWEVAKILGFDEVPVTIVDRDDFDEDAQAFQVVRHNIIHGKMSPKKFLGLYNSLAGKYTEEVAASMFGFAKQEEFARMVNATGKSLPPEMKVAFQKAKKDIKTVEDLSRVLNALFTKHGDTLPFGYMVFDFGGQESVWLRMSQKDKVSFLGLADICVGASKTLDGLMSSLLKVLSTGGADALLNQALELAPTVDVSGVDTSVSEMPTLDYLED